MSNDDSREQGIDFGSLEDELADLEYPVTNADLLDRYGDHGMDLSNGETTLRAILADAPDDDEYGSLTEVRQAIKNFVGSAAVGREGTTGRTSGGAQEYEDDHVG